MLFYISTLGAFPMITSGFMYINKNMLFFFSVIR